MTEAERAQIEAEVMALGDQFLGSMGDLEIETMLSLYDPATMHGNDGWPYYATLDEWRAHLEDLFSGFVAIEGASWTETRIDVLAHDAAHFAGQSDLIVTRENGEKSRVQGSISLLMRNIDGLWKITHQSSVGRWTAVEEG